MTDSSSITVVAILTAKPGSEEAVMAALEPAIVATHQEPGCLAYTLQRDTQDSTKFVFVERWESMQALGSHGQSAHLKEAGEKLADLLAAPMEVMILNPVPLGDPAKGAL
jgi:quinol monooxygenase YgiN